MVEDRAATLAWLDSMLVERNSYIHQIRVDPSFDFVRPEPGYREWERRSGLPPIPAKWQSMLAPRPSDAQHY